MKSTIVDLSLSEDYGNQSIADQFGSSQESRWIHDHDDLQYRIARNDVVGNCTRYVGKLHEEP